MIEESGAMGGVYGDLLLRRLIARIIVRSFMAMLHAQGELLRAGGLCSMFIHIPLSGVLYLAKI